MANNENYDLLFKFIIIGDAGTGKSAILHRFIEDRCMSLHSMSGCFISY